MDRRNSFEVNQTEISGWWFVIFLGLMGVSIGAMVAHSLGPAAVRSYSLGVLAVLFVTGGGLLASLVANQAGLARQWELSQADESTDEISTAKTEHNQRRDRFAAMSSSTGTFGTTATQEMTGSEWTSESEKTPVHQRRRPRRRAV